MSVRVVLLNGPPRAGKDAAAAALLAAIPDACRIGFADELKVRTHRLYGLEAPAAAFEDRKDIPAAEFLGRTPREVYIEVSERLLKPLHGPGVFGRLWLRSARRAVARGARLLVVSDSGFADEAQAGPIALAGPANVLLVRIHRPVRGFAGDSRGYLDLPGIETVDLVNDDLLAIWGAIVTAEVSDWIARCGKRAR